MPPEKRSDALLDALRFLMASSIPAQHKRILIDVVTAALRSDAATQRDLEAQHQAEDRWDPHEIETLHLMLQGKLARSWQEADELLMRLAAQLKRAPAAVRSKATELSLGNAVDYRLARAQLRSEAGS